MKLKAWQELELMQLKKLQAMDRARAEMQTFTEWTWPKYEVNWHHRAKCAALDRFVRGECKRLMIFEPPRHGKSELVSRRLPAFIFGKHPDSHVIAASYSASLAHAMSGDVQKIMEDERYAILFPKSTLNKQLQEEKAKKRTGHFLIPKARGRYLATGVGGGITGQGFHFGIIDDPIKNQEEANSLTYRDRVWNWYTSTFYTRQEREAGILITLTRWHEDDLAGRLLKEDRDSWEIINFPAVCELPKHELDPREEGEPLWPAKYSGERLAEIRKDVGTRVWTSLYQQRPTAQEGGIIKRSWMNQFYQSQPANLNKIILTLDATFKDSSTSDFVVFQVWGKRGSEKFLLDQVRGRMTFSDTCTALRSLVAKWPKCRAKYIEDAANGSAIEDRLKKVVSGIILIRPEGSKDERLSAVAPQFEAGNIWLPDPSIAPWVNDYIEEVVNFPNAPHDDQVDATSMALLRLTDAKEDLLKALSSW